MWRDNCLISTRTRDHGLEAVLFREIGPNVDRVGRPSDIRTSSGECNSQAQLDGRDMQAGTIVYYPVLVARTCGPLAGRRRSGGLVSGVKDVGLI